MFYLDDSCGDIARLTFNHLTPSAILVKDEIAPAYQASHAGRGRPARIGENILRRAV